jgi:hypothetical protein
MIFSKMRVIYFNLVSPGKAFVRIIMMADMFVSRLANG